MFKYSTRHDTYSFKPYLKPGLSGLNKHQFAIQLVDLRDIHCSIVIGISNDKPILRSKKIVHSPHYKYLNGNKSA